MPPAAECDWGQECLTYGFQSHLLLTRFSSACLAGRCPSLILQCLLEMGPPSLSFPHSTRLVPKPCDSYFRNLLSISTQKALHRVIFPLCPGEVTFLGSVPLLMGPNFCSSPLAPHGLPVQLHGTDVGVRYNRVEGPPQPGWYYRVSATLPSSMQPSSSEFGLSKGSTFASGQSRFVGLSPETSTSISLLIILCLLPVAAVFT